MMHKGRFDHIAITRSIERNFSNNGITCRCLWKENKYWDEYPISKLGTESDYYDYEVEKDLLADDVESKFNCFYREYLAIAKDNYIDASNLIAKHKKDFVRFVQFMFYRSEVVLKIVNNNSTYTKVYSSLSHS